MQGVMGSQGLKGDIMTYQKLIMSVVLIACTASAVADEGVRGQELPVQPMLVAMGGENRPLGGNADGPVRRAHSNAGQNGNRGARLAPARGRNEEFGYGFERRQGRRSMPRQQGQGQGQGRF